MMKYKKYKGSKNPHEDFILASAAFLVKKIKLEPPPETAEPVSF
jgi:hypothetical protein